MDSELRERLQTSLGGDYNLEHELGGGMARVFVAEERSLGRKVVVKVLPPELAAEVSVERFRREIQFAAQLQHPLIVPVLTAAQDGELLYYTMPLVGGEPLRARLRREGALPVVDALRILRDIATALAFAHAQGVIHRDIKPENILLTDPGRDGGTGYAIVTDFGVARALDSAAISGELTATGVAIGTPSYMAPEQVTADGRIDQRADIYAAGVVAYEMLTGQPPFVGPSAQAVLAAHVTRQPDPVSRLRPSVSGAVDALVTRCLAKAPADRLTSAAELRREVEALLVRETASALDAPHAGTTASAASPAGARRRRLAVAGVLALGAAAAVLWVTRPGSVAVRRAGEARLGSRSVAVMPFENTSPDSANEYFSDGVTDELIDALARVPELRVTSRSSSFAFKGSRLGARVVGDSLGVEMVLEGSIRKERNQVRITTQLTRVRDGSAIWSQRYDRELLDVFAVQEELAQSILTALRQTFGEAVSSADARATGAPLVRRTTSNQQAYDAYIRGRHFWSRRTRDGIVRAAAYFEEAIRLDSSFAAAWAGLADSYCILANFGYRPAREVCPRSADAARRAIALDGTLAEAHASLGFVNLFHYWDLGMAERELNAAVRLDSTYANGHLWLNHLAWARGDTNGAIAHARKAAALEPLSPIHNSRLGIALWRAGKLEEAIEQLRYTLELDSSFIDARRARGLVQLDRGEYDDAIAEMRRTGQPTWIAYALARAGRREEAERMTRELEAARRRGQWVAPIMLAYIHTALGNADSSFAFLEQAYVTRDPDVVFIAHDPYFEPLRGDPRFAVLQRRVGVARWIVR